MKIFGNLRAILRGIITTRTFYPEKVFKNKRVAIIGAADSAFEGENGRFIDSFDVVVRINKALVTWSAEKELFIGKKTDVLFHSFYENESSGGGPIQFKNFKGFGLKFLVHPNTNYQGLRTHLNFLKRHPETQRSYLLSRKTHKKITKHMKNFIPTVGFSALFSVLDAPCKQIYITGFTFFKTSYAPGYRDHLVDIEENDKHIKDQAMHNPTLELQLFKKLLDNSPCKNIVLDDGLKSLIIRKE